MEDGNCTEEQYQHRYFPPLAINTALLVALNVLDPDLARSAIPDSCPIIGLTPPLKGYGADYGDGADHFPADLHTNRR